MDRGLLAIALAAAAVLFFIGGPVASALVFSVICVLGAILR